jgi:hypothetical protein
MSDTKKTPAKTSTAKPGAHVAKKGVTDRGQNVSTAAGQPVDGQIADLADGDKPKHHRRPKK